MEQKFLDFEFLHISDTAGTLLVRGLTYTFNFVMLQLEMTKFFCSEISTLEMKSSPGWYSQLTRLSGFVQHNMTILAAQLSMNEL